MVTIGILGLQGDIRIHENIMEKVFKQHNIDEKVKIIKYIDDLEDIDGLIIPGGESTVIGSLAKKIGLFDALKSKIIDGLPTLGVCAGLVFLAKKVYDKTVGKINQAILGVLEVDIERNSFGTQRESFETDLDIPVLGEEPYKTIFIRAPVIKDIGPDVEILAKFDENIVAVRQDNIIGVAFHPELNGDTRFHKFFLETIKK